MKYAVPKPTTACTFHIQAENDYKLRDAMNQIKRRSGRSISMTYILDRLITNADAEKIIKELCK